VAPRALPRLAHHRADLWHLFVRQTGSPGPGGILVSGDNSVAVFEEPPPRGGFSFALYQFPTNTRSAGSDEIPDRRDNAKPGQLRAAAGVARPRIRYRLGQLARGRWGLLCLRLPGHRPAAHPPGTTLVGPLDQHRGSAEEPPPPERGGSSACAARP